MLEKKIIDMVEALACAKINYGHVGHIYSSICYLV